MATAASPSLLRLLAERSGTATTGLAGCPECDNVHDGGCYVPSPRRAVQVDVAPVFTGRRVPEPKPDRKLNVPGARVYVSGGRAATLLQMTAHALRSLPDGEEIRVGLAECDNGCATYAMADEDGRLRFNILHSPAYGCRSGSTEVIVSVARTLA